MGSTYKIRFFFDAGSGTCFWSGNDAARERFGYFIDPYSLPLDITTRQEVLDVITAYDEAFNWDDPGSASPIDPTVEVAINARSDAMLQRVREQLGEAFDVVDERS
ncbi:MAG: hypothetical protein GYA24_14325 [Candidatus Lokiarchaeota archaeon]|nr:hypothetical protein [Candidatus Lokiarchaeota archaeon]